MFYTLSTIIIVISVLLAPKILNYLCLNKIITGRGTGLLQIIFDTSDKYLSTVFKGLNKSAYLMILFRFILIGIQFIFLKGGNISQKDQHYKRISTICFLNNVFYVMVSLIYHTYYVQRITLYIDYYFVLLLPYMYWGKLSHYKMKKYETITYRNTTPSALVMFIVLLIYWFFAFIYHGYDYTNMFILNTL